MYFCVILNAKSHTMQRILLLLLTFAATIASAQTGTFISSERFSSGMINDICQDKYGYIWIATDYGLNKFDGYRFTSYFHHQEDSTTLSDNNAVSLFCDPKGQLWIGTRKGLDRYDYASDNFTHIPFPDNIRPRVSDISRQTDDQLWVCTAGYGMFALNDKAKRLEAVSDLTTKEEGFFYNRIYTDSSKRVWKCGYGTVFTMKDQRGIHRFNSTLGDIVFFAEKDNELLIFCLRGIHVYRNGQLETSDIDQHLLYEGEKVINRIHKDSQGNIYVGTRGSGLLCLKAGSRALERVTNNAQGIDLNTAKVWAIAEDRQGNIWVGCQSKGLVILPRRHSKFQMWSFSAQGVNISSTVTSICEGDGGITWCTVQGNGVFGLDVNGQVKAHPSAPSNAEMMYRDKKGNYWLGTDDALYAYDPITGRSQRKITFDCDRYNDMTDNGDGHLYVSTFSRGFCSYDLTTGELHHFNSDVKDETKGWICNRWVLAMTHDRKGRIWLATADGVSCYDPKADTFKPFGWMQLLKGALCYSLCETSQGHILIGTDQGLYDYEPGKAEAVVFSGDDELRNKAVGYIVEANNGDIWCSTTMGIWQFDAKKKQLVSHISGNGLTTKEYINCVGLHTDNDLIYFANNDGLTVFRPAEVADNQEALPEVKLTGLMIGGKPVNTNTKSNGHQILKGPAILSDQFRVSYLDNTMSLEYSLLEYDNLGSVSFDYRINNGDWITMPVGQNAILLSHLQPGSYDIDVRAQAHGQYSETKTIHVTVSPPWYRTTLARLLYLIALLALIGAIGWAWRRKQRHLMDEEKMKFLINATHDIRSPLTLIHGPLTKLKTIVSDETGKVYLETIERNAEKLMMLVNQILDQRRIDKNEMRLHCQETNMVEFISSVCKLFQYEAQQRNIAFTFEHAQNNVPLWLDRMSFDKVVSNLLSNAFKYTSDGGEIKVALISNDKDVEVRFIDSGVGFKKGESTKNLFKRFHQGSNSVNLTTQGTGIGLNLCQSIIELHGGRIKAENRNDGQRGACITVRIPKGNQHLKPEQIVDSETKSEVLSTARTTRRKDIRVMIVDDNQEILDYIRFELGGFYKFTICPNGKEALKTLLTDSKRCDIVVSDIMMPEMDGIELLKHIKENPQTSDIPVILLTSKTEVDYRLEGLKKGADAYLAKPFDMEELHVQIDNLVSTVRRLKGVFSGASTQKDKVEDIEVKGNDEQLMNRIMASINANLSDADYNVEALAKDVGLSRAQLHRKMKEMTGLATGRFVRDIRMRQAGRLIRQGNVNISQVAYSVGFSDQAHFSTVFKTYYGVTPSEYAAQKDHKEEFEQQSGDTP